MSKVTYNQIEELTGKPYRSIKKHLDNIGVSGSRQGNKVFFESKDVLMLKSEDLAKNDKDYTQLLEYEKYREKKRLNDLEEYKVAPVDLITDALSKTATQIIPILESLPLEMKKANPTLTGKDIQLVKKSVVKCRNLIAETKINLDDD